MFVLQCTVLSMHFSLCADISPPDLGIGQSMAIAIQPSDDAFGRFSFSPNSLSHIAPEQAGGIPLSFTVIREGGTFGEVEVYWAASQGNMEGQVMDVSPATGVAVFAEGERQQEFTVFVTDDLVQWLPIYLLYVIILFNIQNIDSRAVRSYYGSSGECNGWCKYHVGLLCHHHDSG